MTLALACIAAFVSAVIQRITGLGFVLVLVGPIVLLYGPLEGVRGLPASPVADVWLLVGVTVSGIVLATMLTRFVPARMARIAMLSIAWTGAAVVLGRGLLALWT